MKKVLLIVSIITVMMLVGVPQALSAEDSITITVTMEVIGVGIDTPSWDLGIIAPSAQITSSGFTATNLGNVTEDFTITTGDSVNWSCSTSGANSFGIGFDLNLLSPTFPGTGICGIVQTLGSSVAGTVPGPSGGTVDFLIHFFAPSSATIAGPETITVTVTASKTP